MMLFMAGIVVGTVIGVVVMSALTSSKVQSLELDIQELQDELDDANVLLHQEGRIV